MIDVDISYPLILSLFIFIIGAISRFIDPNFGKKGWLWILSGATFFLTAEALVMIDWSLLGLKYVIAIISQALNLFGIFFIIIGVSRITKELIFGS